MGICWSWSSVKIISFVSFSVVSVALTTKAVFKEAMRGIVPDQILDRKDKVGFESPEREWLEQLGPWVEETLAEASDIPVFNQEKLRQTWNEIKLGKKEFNWQ